MVQAGREHDMHVTENLTTKDITRWKFGQDDEGRLSLCSCQLRIERNGDQKVQITQVIESTGRLSDSGGKCPSGAKLELLMDDVLSSIPGKLRRATT
jgi:hypothetical protein